MQMEATILIPMAGEGSRFRSVGFLKPKPMIDVGGKPMIMWVIENILPKSFKLKAKIIVVIQRDQDVQFQVASQLLAVLPGVEIVYAERLTDGAACTCLLAKEHIKTESPLFIVNSDQFLVWDSDAFWTQVCMERGHADGNILCFKHPVHLNDTKWSYARVDSGGFVQEVREKEVISENATVGAYFWQCGADFVSAAEEMIRRDIRVNGEFYVAPVYNMNVERGLRISLSFCSRMWGLGVPDDLVSFLSYYVRPARMLQVADTMQCSKELFDDTLPMAEALERIRNLQDLKFVSNCGNTCDRNIEDEGNPRFVVDAITAGFDVKIDVWFYARGDPLPSVDFAASDVKATSGRYYVGCAAPRYEVSLEFLERYSKHLWICCRNVRGLSHFAGMPGFQFFSEDGGGDLVLTSHRNQWTREGWLRQGGADNTASMVLGATSIAAMFSEPERLLGHKIMGICANEVVTLRKRRDELLVAVQIKMLFPAPRMSSVEDTFQRVKLVVLDLDGVLVESKELHYEAMNQAITAVAGSKFAISRDEHLLVFDGLSTKQKLHLLTTMKGLSEALHARIWDKKQELTRDLVQQTVPANSDVREAILALKAAGFPVAIASNCIRESAVALLQAVGVFDVVDALYSNGMFLVFIIDCAVCFLSLRLDCLFLLNLQFSMEDIHNGMFSRAIFLTANCL
jgi:dTDP-glucose pyrophosphorylase